MVSPMHLKTKGLSLHQEELQLQTQWTWHQACQKSGQNLTQIAMLYPLTLGKHVSIMFEPTKSHHIDDMDALQHFHIGRTTITSLFLWRSGFEDDLKRPVMT